MTGTDSVEQNSAGYENLEVRRGGVLRVSRSGRVRSFTVMSTIPLGEWLCGVGWCLPNSLMVDSDRDHAYAVYQGRSTIMGRYKGD